MRTNGQQRDLVPAVRVAKVTSSAIPDRTFPGKVTRFAHALAPGTRTLLTEVNVPNPDGALFGERR